jgi:Ca2+-binding RTX toxin-like protein
MARIISDALFLQSLYSFRPMFTESIKTEFFNNQPFGYETLIPWNDAIETAYVAGRGTNFTTAFAGDALTIAPRNIETGSLSGRVEGIFTYVGHRATSDLEHATSIWGINVGLREIQTVALTPDQADDAALMQRMLAGNDVIRLGRFGDKVNGFDGNDVIETGAGSDQAFGGAGNDRLVGQSGFDTLYGSVGDDTLIGGAGADELYGGLGRDVFVFDDRHLGMGIGARDIVFDWNPREDVLDFSRIDANTRVAGDQGLRFESSNDGAFLNVSNSVVMYVSGLDVMFRFEVTGDGIPDFDLRMVGAERFYTYLFKDASGEEILQMFDF